MEIDEAEGIVISSPTEFQHLTSDLVSQFSLKRESISTSDSSDWTSILIKVETLGFFDRIRGIDQIQYRQEFTYDSSTGKHSFLANWYKVKNGNFDKIENYTKGSVNPDEIYSEILSWNKASNKH